MDYISIYKKHLPHLKKIYGDEWKCLCPFHFEKTPSFSVNEKTGFYNCLGCGIGGGVVGFLEKIGHPEDKPERTDIRLDESISIKFTESISPKVVEQLHRNLINDYQKLQYVLRERRVSYFTIKKYVLGYDTSTDRFAFPIRTITGKFYNIKLHNSNSSPKAIYYKTGTSARLFPASSLSRNQIIICEGEFDCMALQSLGINAITPTSGAGKNKWDEAWNHLFVDKDVKIIYDSDEAGRDGNLDVQSNLVKYAKSVEIINFPDYSIPKDGKMDITDFIKSGGDVFRLLKIQRKK